MQGLEETNWSPTEVCCILELQVLLKFKWKTRNRVQHEVSYARLKN